VGPVVPQSSYAQNDGVKPTHYSNGEGHLKKKRFGFTGVSSELKEPKGRLTIRERFHSVIN